MSSSLIGGTSGEKLLGLLDQAMVDGVEGEFEAVGNAEFVENIVQVILYGLFADEELFADFAVAEALGDQLNDFFFAIAEQRLFAARAGFGGLLEGVDHFGGHAIVQPDFAVVDFADALQQQIAGGLLQHDAARAQAHGANHVAIVFGGGEHDDARRQSNRNSLLRARPGRLFPACADRAEEYPASAWRASSMHSLPLEASPTICDVVGAFEQLAQAVAKDGVVVRHQDANRLFRFRHVNSMGFLRSAVPRGPDSTPPSAYPQLPAFAP